MKKINTLYAIFALGRILKGSVEADKRYLKILYQYKMKKKLNLDNPITYNEKLQWLKLYDRDPQYAELVDKYNVKKYVSNKIDSKYIVSNLGIWNNFDEIDFDKLPNQFVLKCTHDSGGVVIVRDKGKLDLKNTKKKINHCLKRDYFMNLREWPYKNVPHRIIAEELIGTREELPIDYKFYCFDGHIDSVMLCLDRESGKPKFVYYDMEWNRLTYQKYEPKIDGKIDKPANFEEMISIVEKLCKEFKQVRIDLYNVNGKIYFSEITFFNQSGFDTDITYETDLFWGSKLILNNDERYLKDGWK